MPRSPLMRQVRQALRLSLAAQRAHLDDDHVLELRGQHFQHHRMLVRARPAARLWVWRPVGSVPAR